QMCGDAACNGTETACSCPGDCAPGCGPTRCCGDGTCCEGGENPEDSTSCPADCPAPPPP
ncbi:MAG TPA: hypothetical protein VFU21_12410, partial [Kofleriaceae bacterium]|nr:hypothetical protein [Kofleriaceae bacterium]